MRRYLLPVILSATALACSQKTDVKPEPPPPASASAGSLATPVGPSSAEAREVDRSPIAVTESPQKLALTGTKLDIEILEERAQMWIGDRQLVVHPVRNRLLVTYAGFVTLLEDNRLEFIDHLWPQEAYEFTVIAGVYPSAMVARVEFDSWASPGFQRQAPIKRTDYIRFEGAAWSRNDLTKTVGTPAAAWRDGAILSLQERALSVLGADNKPGTPPTQAPPRDAGRCKDSPSEVIPEGLDALPSGEAFVIGKRCGGEGYAVERWASDPAASTVENLPGAPAAAKRAFFSAGSRDRGYAVLSTGDGVYAARWDGLAFRKVELKAEGDVRAAWTAPDGTLFFVLQLKSATPRQAKAELVRVTMGGELSRSAHFAASPSARVWAADAQTAYVAAYGTILSTRPGLTFVKPKEDEKTAGSAPPSSGLPAYTDGCAAPFVFLYDISSRSPPGYDFPSTRKALSTFARVADISLIEFMHASKRRLGVLVPSAEVGKDVIAHVNANMKDEHPELVCLAPGEGVRVIPIR